MKGFTCLIPALILTNAVVGYAGEPHQTFYKLKSQLERQQVIIGQVQKTVEKQDLSRLLTLKHEIASTREELDASGLGTIQMIQKLEELVLFYDFSHDLFHRIETESTKAMLAELVSISDSMKKGSGLDRSKLTRLTASTFRQMHDLFVRLKDVPVSERVQFSVEDLIQDLGRVVAIASDGDDARAYKEAKPVHDKIEALYPGFHDIPITSSAYEIASEIEGLNDFYAHLTKLDASL